MIARTLAALSRAVIDNPAFSRQLTTTLSGTKLALVFLFVNGALIASTLLAIIAGNEEPSLRAVIDRTGLGLVLEAINSSVIYGVLAILLPLQAARLFEAQRLDHVFDQLVVTGVRPARLHFGNWASTMALAAVVLAATLPYQAFAYAVTGVGLLDLVSSYAIFLAYSNVIALVTMAIAVMVTEFLAAPLSVLLFIALGLIALTPLPTVLVFWTPVRWLLSAGPAQLHLTEYFLSGLYSSAAVFGLAIPYPVLAAVLWGLFAALALVVLALGPSHRFTPGLNNFGNVVLRGDRKRSRLRTLRFHLNRRVEMAFLYENRPARWDGWDWALRALSIIAAAVVFWAVAIGWIFDPSVLGKGKLDWVEMQVYILSMGGVGAAFGLLAYGESRNRIHDRDRLGPFRVPREALSLLFFAALLGLFVAFTYLPSAVPLRSAMALIGSISHPQGDGLQSGELLTMKEQLDALPERIGILAIFAVNLFLLSRLIARISLTAGSARVKLFSAGLILLFIPMILVPLYQEKEIRSRTVARAAFASPMIALWESIGPTDRVFHADRLGSGKDLYWTIQGSLAAAQLFLILSLAARRRRASRRDPRAGTGARSPRALAAVAVLLLALAPMRAGAGEEFSAEVIRGFNGHGFNENFDSFTLTIARPEPGAAADRADRIAEFWLETEAGEPYMAAGTIEVPPGTRKQVRFAPARGTEYRNSGDPVRLMVRMNGVSRNLEVPPLVIDPPDKLRFLAVSQDGKVPPLQLPSQSWVGIKPELLAERMEAYCGCDMVLVGASDFGAWTAPQRRALYDFLRSGGTIIFSGAIDERSLAAQPEWAEILTPAEPPRTEVREIAFRVHRLRNAPVVWADGDGPGALPVLQLRSFGPGFAGYLAVDPLAASTAQRFGGPERFWKLLTDRAPTSLCAGQLVTVQGPGWTHLSGKSILAVGAYFAIYAMALGPVMLLLFRTRRKRFWAWVYAPAVSVVFAVSAPWALRWILSEPSSAAELSVTFVGSGGDAVRHTQVQIRSAGRQEHRLSIPLEDLTVAEGLGDGRWPLTGSDPGRVPPAEVKFSIAPWGQRRLYLISRGAAEPAAEIHGRVTAQRQGKRISAWTCEVEGLQPGTETAWIQIYNSTEPGRVEDWSESIAGWINPAGPAKGTITAGSRPNRSIPMELRVTRARAFLFWTGISSVAVESPDIIFGENGSGRRAYFFKELEVVNPGEKSDTK